MDMNRREFLRAAGLAGGAALLGGPGLAACADAPTSAKVARLALPPDSVLAHPASECPIARVVVLMMENRSFDPSLGWRGKAPQYQGEGVRRYGKEFQVDGQVNVRYRDQF